jgi:glyoxylase-like metal-dependent hydrolase (beta-lactamase superfamily II)
MPGILHRPTMDQNRLMLLGTKGGPAVRPGGPMPTSSLLWLKGRPMVVDCGLGVTRSAVNGGLELRQLQLIFITHCPPFTFKFHCFNGYFCFQLLTSP